MPSDPRDYKLDLTGLPPADAAPSSPTSQSARPFLSILFRCCNVYARVYRSPDATAYAGRCPRCARQVQFQVGQGGTDSRSFVVE